VSEEKDMNSFRILRRQVEYIAVAVALVVVTILPVVASAEQLTERSIELSSSSAGAEGVQYNVKFTADGDAGAFILDFCANTPTIGQACTTPTDFVATNAVSVTAGFTANALDANTLRVVGTIEEDDEVEVELTTINNPTAVGPVYVRIVTYDTAVNAADYESDDLGMGVVDQGSAAISITETIGVSGAVLESMLFCVSGTAIDVNCTDTTTPVVELGETVGDVKALIPTALSTGTVHAQLSTNAVTGAVVNLKSNAAGCGGLLRAGAPAECDITPALAGGIAVGQAKFGLMVSAATDTIGYASATGTILPYPSSNYNASTYTLNWANDNATGVTSAFGDPFLYTNNAPVNNKNVALTFGASVSNDTPAGTYSADLSLIATGKF
jgi:hypothetical protein